MKTRINFTKRELDKIPLPPPGQRYVFHDTGIAKLTLRVSSSGSKSFYVQKRIGSNTDRILIGKYPDTPIELARQKALSILATVARGDGEELRAECVKPTVGQAIDKYMTGHVVPNCARAEETRANLDRHFGNWMGRKLADVSISEVQERMNQISVASGKHAANRSLNDIKAAVNWCIKSGIYTGNNPWAHASSAPTEARERFVSMEEMPRFISAVHEADEITRDFVLICLYTGARKTNVMTMRWEEIDFAAKTWRIPKTKGGRSHLLPLTERAITLLNGRSTNSTSDWVFSGTAAAGHMAEPNRAWHKLLEQAGITDLRIHDLRRTHASYMAMSGQSLPMIGKVLGHRSPTATQVYARLALAPVRQAMEISLEQMLAGTNHIEPLRQAKEKRRKRRA